jgi:hypothetical protein
MKTNIAIATLLLCCSCASTRNEGTTEALSGLYGQAISDDPCWATYYLFHADPHVALPAFLEVLTELQEPEPSLLPRQKIEDPDFTRYVMFDRAITELHEKPNALARVLLRCCQDPSEEIRALGLFHARELAGDAESPHHEKALSVLRELKEAEQAESTVPSKAAPSASSDVR